MDWREHISVKPNVCHGKACIVNTRVLVSIILDNLAARDSAQVIANAYHITLEDISEVLAYASALARDEIIPTGAA